MRGLLGLVTLLASWAAARHLRSVGPTDAAALQRVPLPHQPEQGDVFAIADLHGDVDKAAAALKLLGVVDDRLSWTARGVTLVQLGDMPDRGPSSTGVVALFSRLADEAAAVGSRVITLLGNHDLMALSGDVRYVSPTELMRLGAAAAGGGGTAGDSSGEDGGPDDVRRPSQAPPAAAQDPDTWPEDRQRAAMAAGLEEWRRQLGEGQVFGDTLRRRSLLALEGEGPCRTLFVHAGLLPRTLRDLFAGLEEGEAAAGGDSAADGEQQHLRQHHRQQQQQQQQQDAGHSANGRRRPLPELTAAAVERINAAAVRLLRSCVQGVCAALPRPRSATAGRLAAALQSGDGPVWNRALAQAPEASVCPAVDRLLVAAGGAARIVVGHTVQAGGRARSRCGGRVLLLDTGMSADMEGAPAAGWVCRRPPNGGAVGGAEAPSSGPEAAAAALLSMVIYADGLGQTVGLPT